MDNHSHLANRPFIIFIVILSFVTGVLGGVGGIALISSSTSLQKSLGFTSSEGTLTLPGRTENITVKEDSAVIDAVKKVSPAVVSVTFTKNVQVINPFANLFGQSQDTVQQEQGGGTGFIITAEGLIATNKHVANVDGAEYTVITQDGKKYKADVVAKDPANDFAIMKIDAKNLPVVDFGDSDNLDVGQRVIAIGNALGEFQNSVTVGVLSGKERSLTASDTSGGTSEALEGLLQTDAAINEGNSGGPLINLHGQVIGINTATTSKSQAEGIGFAVPINSLKSAVDSFKKNGKIIRPYLGVRYAMIDEKVAALKGLTAGKGALVVGDSAQGQPAVVSGSPAEKAGLKEGDVILKVNGETVGEGKSLSRALNSFQPNEEVTLKILRDGKEQEVKVKLGEMSS